VRGRARHSRTVKLACIMYTTNWALHPHQASIKSSQVLERQKSVPYSVAKRLFLVPTVAAKDRPVPALRPITPFQTVCHIEFKYFYLIF
jgi:hypothetical protein